MSDLEILAKKFKEWRGDRRYYRYSKHFWDEIKQLAKHHPTSAIAEAFGINHQYLQKKLGQDSQSLTFASVTVTSCIHPISIEFIDQNSRLMTIRFQADSEQLIHMIQSLSGKKS